MRITTDQPATSRPQLIAESGIGTGWLTVAEAPDYSVPDTTRRWPNDRDPADDDRRVQPGQALLTTPLFAHNTAADPRWIEVQVIAEDGTTALIAAVTIPPGDTYSLPCAGMTMTKTQIGTSQGGRMQVRAEEAGVIDVTGTVNIGAAEQDQPG